MDLNKLIQDALTAAKAAAAIDTSPAVKAFFSSVVQDPSIGNWVLQLNVLATKLVAEIPDIDHAVLTTIQTELQAQITAYLAKP